VAKLQSCTSHITPKYLTLRPHPRYILQAIDRTTKFGINSGCLLSLLLYNVKVQGNLVSGVQKDIALQ